MLKEHESSSDSGSEYGSHLKSRHHCTDIPCCLVFAAFLAAFSVLYGYGIQNGNVKKIFHGIDYQGKICGVDAEVATKPYLYWCDKGALGSSLKLSLSKPICVESCPADTGVMVPDCVPVVGLEGMTAYKSIAVMNRYCMPDTEKSKKATAALEEGPMADSSQKFLEDLSSIPASWPVLLGAFFVAVFLGYVWMLLMRCCAGPLIWSTIVLVIVGFGALGAYMFVNAGQMSQNFPDNVKVPEGYGQHEETATKVIAGFLFVCSFVCLCMACCFRSSIDAACACVEVAVEAIFEMPSLLFAPILKAVVKGSFALILIFGFFLLLSTAPMTSPLMDPNSKTNLVGQAVSSQAQGVYRHFELTGQQKGILVGYVFVAFWIECFLNALYQFIIAYAMAEYYYAPIDEHGDKDVPGCCALFDGAQVGIFYHTGSLAFGSALVAIFSTLQLIIAAIEYQQKASGTSNPVVTAILSCVGSIVTCFKWIVELINRNAYVDIAITSNDFCSAAKNAVGLIIQLAGSMAVLNGATIVFSIFGCLLVGIGCGAFAFFAAQTATFTDPTSTYFIVTPVPVAIVSGFIGISVAACFMMVFDMASDALLYCYGVDMKKGKASPNAPEALKDLVHNQGHGEEES
ncbi:unnamed protein product [Polarella glacialis]|uniref:Choline transporter-like protein n=1 Tax=Polarella glacialis TaxID=89957 RepID=A0A813LP98_POLGL|nr:unnamed protein product [Polarella glacialis]